MRASLAPYRMQVLSKLPAREQETKDAAKVALRNPCWTISSDTAELELVCKLAGYKSLQEAREFHVARAADEQTEKLTGGKAPAQVALDRAAHLMDAVVFGHRDWQDIRKDLAALYNSAGMSDIADSLT